MPLPTAVAAVGAHLRVAAAEVDAAPTGPGAQLRVYLRQSHAERDLAGRGALGATGATG